MKTLICTLLLVLGIHFIVDAQDVKLRKKYRNLSFSQQKLSLSENSDFELKSNYGGAFTTGRSYYLHKKPILGMIRIGIDATWFDLNYGNYTLEEPSYDGYTEGDKSDWHQAEISMHVGPSITVSPVKGLNVHMYFRYAPSFSGIYADETFRGNYATFFVTGACISYKVIGLGVESRWGDTTYKELFGGDDEDESDIPDLKFKTSGIRAYLSFRF